MKWLVVQGRPKIQRVAGRAALAVETLKNVLLQVDRKTAAAFSRAAMYRTRATPLRSAAAELVKMVQMAEHSSDADLLAKVTIIHRKPGGMVDRRLLEKCRRIG